MELPLLGLYFVVLSVLCTYGAHRLHLVLLCWRRRERIREPQLKGPELMQKLLARGEEHLPRVTVQLPLYNEATVVVRLLEAAAKIDYPSHLLEIQVLDDSNDETQKLAEAKVDELRKKGVDIHYMRRPNRVGYKAGALDYGLQRAKGDFIAIFDADFVPQASFLKDVMAHFEDEKIAVVQTRWGHMNRNHSALTNIQALMLDGHHLVENRARFGADCFFNFSGTGGVWRAKAIADAGGWQHDTVTEDLDLSYRAQLKGWKFVYRPDVLTPSELPESLTAFRAQQYRWAKGTVQTARKLLPTVLRAKQMSVGQRIEACFHMTPHFAYPLMLTLTILILPAIVFMPAKDVNAMLLVDLPLCLGSTGSLALFYCLAEHAQGRSIWNALMRLPVLIALGAGLAPNQTKAVFEGLRQMSGEFVRTPKKGNAAGRYRAATKLPLGEVFMFLLSTTSTVAALETGHWFAAPFTFLFALGFAYVAYTITTEELARRRESAQAAETQRIAGHA